MSYVLLKLATGIHPQELILPDLFSVFTGLADP